MNALEFIASLVRSVLSWPVVALAVVFLLRGPLTELIGRVRSGELMGNKWTFGDRLGHAEETTEAALVDVDVQDAVNTEAASALAADQGLDAAVTILKSWERLTAAVRGLYSAVGLESTGRGRPPLPTAMAIALQESGVVNEAYVRSIRELQQLRNEVAHGRHDPTSGEAAAYTETVTELTRAAEVLATYPGRPVKP